MEGSAEVWPPSRSSQSFHEGMSANLRIHGEVRDRSDKWVVTGMHCGSNALQPILQLGR